MPMRCDPAADSASAHAHTALRLPFPRNLGRAAGKNLQASRLSAQAGNGRGSARTESDDLFAAEEARRRAGEKSQMPSGLRPHEPCIQERLSQAEETRRKVLRTETPVWLGGKSRIGKGNAQLLP